MYFDCVSVVLEAFYMFPDSWTFSVVRPINSFFKAFVVEYGDFFEAIANNILQVLVVAERGLGAIPWWLVLMLLFALGWHSTRKWGIGLLLAVCFLCIGLLGLWALAIQSLALMLVSVLFAVIVGTPVGIMMAMMPRFRLVLLPILDAMQTLPSFVYLVPALMLFGLGKVPALFATVIYALPPLIRLTHLGIVSVNAPTIEAARAFGASRWQVLTQVQLPLALPTIMTGINQTTMMALSMVVIASMIGARGLGEQVLLGIQRLDIGSGLVAGLSIVFFSNYI